MIFVEMECGRTRGTTNEISAKSAEKTVFRLLVMTKLTLQNTLQKGSGCVIIIFAVYKVGAF